VEVFEKYPEFAQEWHPVKNGDYTPFQVPPRSGFKAWWRCSRGHEWIARIADRTAGTRWPYCHPNISRLEIRIYCELKTVFPNVISKKRIDNSEIDIYLLEHRLGIEIDGFPWHEESEERDRRKEKNLGENGIIIIRLRDDRLTHQMKNGLRARAIRLFGCTRRADTYS
jgi:hypothetical protein